MSSESDGCVSPGPIPTLAGQDMRGPPRLLIAAQALLGILCLCSCLCVRQYVTYYYVCVRARVYVILDLFKIVCVCVFVCTCMRACVRAWFFCLCLCLCLCISVFVYVCAHVDLVCGLKQREAQRVTGPEGLKLKQRQRQLERDGLLFMQSSHVPDLSYPATPTTPPFALHSPCQWWATDGLQQINPGWSIEQWQTLWYYPVWTTGPGGLIPKLLRSIIGINELINTYYRPSNNR